MRRCAVKKIQPAKRGTDATRHSIPAITIQSVLLFQIRNVKAIKKTIS